MPHVSEEYKRIPWLLCFHSVFCIHRHSQRFHTILFQIHTRNHCLLRMIRLPNKQATA